MSGNNKHGLTFRAVDASGDQCRDGHSDHNNQEGRQTGECIRQAASGGDASLETGPEYQIKLKNGAMADLMLAKATWQTLMSVSDTHPALVVAVLELAQGKQQPPDMLRELRKALLTQPNGELRDVVRDVVLSAYQETTEGAVLVNPFLLDSEADRKAFEECEQRSKRNWLRILRPDDPREGRS
jgi:hypothetical protein